MIASLDIVWQTALRTWRKTLRRPVPLTFSFVQPLFWMLIFGFLFHRFALGPVFERFSYPEFLLPGVCCMTVLFGASQTGITIVRDLQTGFLQRMVRASSHSGAIVTGKVAADVARLLAQAVVVALLGTALGAGPVLDPLPLIGATVALALFALAYTCLSCWIALMTGAQESVAVFVHVVNMPLLFTSTALVPSRQMPEWLEAVSHGNPLSLVANAMRGALLLRQTPDASTLLLLAAIAAVLFAAAWHAMSRATRD